MRKRLGLVLGLSVALFALVPAAAATPNNESATFEWHIFTPNMSEAPNGDQVAIDCAGEDGGTFCGTFSVHPKSVDASGNFTHTDSEGNVLGFGTWTATELLAFQPYGCGVVGDEELPENFCGGMLKLAVVLDTPAGQFDAILTSFCVVGPNPPDSHDELAEEGATLNIIGQIHFNQVVEGGTNIYIKM